YVFFDAGASTLSERYHHFDGIEVSSFRESKLPGSDRLALYREVLNTIGSRLRENPSSKVTLIACADPSMQPDSAATVARDRGATVKDYLVNTWGIDPQRIAQRTRTLPDHPSPVTDTDGVAEDRRVEITSNDPVILAPVFTADTLRTASPPTIRFHPTVKSERGIAHWTVA